MTVSYRISKLAEDDLADIWDFTLEQSQEVLVADKVLLRIHEIFDNIAVYPGVGHWREDIAPKSVRFRSVFEYVIAYRLNEGITEIIAVLHGARLLSRLMQERM